MRSFPEYPVGEPARTSWHQRTGIQNPIRRSEPVLHEKSNPRDVVFTQVPPRGPTPGSGPDDGTPDPAEMMVVSRARDGDREAFRSLVETHHPEVYRVAIRVLRCNRQTAEDMCQEVFLRAFRGLPSFGGEVRFGAWLHTIAMNACITEYRKQRTLKRGRPTFSLDAPVAGTDDLHVSPPSRELDPGERVHQAEFSRAVRIAVSTLPEEFRDAVLLRDLQGLSYEEIGQLLAVPAGTVRSRIHRGRLILQDKLKEFV